MRNWDLKQFLVYLKVYILDFWVEDNQTEFKICYFHRTFLLYIVLFRQMYTLLCPI